MRITSQVGKKISFYLVLFHPPNSLTSSTCYNFKHGLERACQGKLVLFSLFWGVFETLEHSLGKMSFTERLCKWRENKYIHISIQCIQCIIHVCKTISALPLADPEFRQCGKFWEEQESLQKMAGNGDDNQQAQFSQFIHFFLLPYRKVSQMSQSILRA